MPRHKLHQHNRKFDMLLRGIVMTRGENGATIEEMRTDYFRMFGEHWLLMGNTLAETVSYLIDIDGLMMEKQSSGLCIWYIDDIGSSMIERHIDSNNNGTVAGQSDDSNGFVDPQRRRQMLTSSSFVRGNTVPPSVSSSTATESSSTMSATAEESSQSTEVIDDIQPIENACEPATTKRKLSQGNCSHVEKRMKATTEPDRVPLNEKNVNIHNWNSGPNGIVKQVTTSTVKGENSLLNGATNEVGIDVIEGIDGIEIVSVSDYQEPIKETELKKLQK